jgi:cytochrome c553
VTPAPEAEAAPVATLEADNTPAAWGDAQAGAGKAAACAACHGLDGNSADPQYPKLAGQHERYIARQLTLYKSGERVNPIMMGFASTLSSQDMRDIGAYFATQKVLPGVADDSAIAQGANQGRKFFEVGERLFRSGKADSSTPACQACHGPGGAGNPGPSWPSLNGQHATYTAAALTAFRAGEVWGKDANANAVMSAVAANLSDEEIQALSTYIEGLHNVADAPSAEALAQVAAAPAPSPAPAADAAATDAAAADDAAPAEADGETPPRG